MSQLPGLYRGRVVNNNDKDTNFPLSGRVQIHIPQIHGEFVNQEDLPWAEPCMPMFGGGWWFDQFEHGTVAIPPIWSSVWVAFEAGNVDRPIYLGTWYGKRGMDTEEGGVSELPVRAQEDEKSSIKYPDIFLLKAPWSEFGPYIRMARHVRMEFVLSDDPEDYAYIDLDLNTYSINIKTKLKHINIESEEGDVTIKGRTVKISASDTLQLTGDPAASNAGGPGNVYIQSVAGELFCSATGVSTFASSVQIVGSAPSAYGFALHPY